MSLNTTVIPPNKLDSPLKAERFAKQTKKTLKTLIIRGGVLLTVKNKLTTNGALSNRDLLDGSLQYPGETTIP